MTGAAAHTDPGARLVVLAESLFEELAARVRDFLSTEKGGAVVLLCAALAALLWANSPWPASYESFWATKLSIRVGGGGISMDLRSWVNQGLMSFFFLVVGLEARRELTLGELRRAATPNDSRRRRSRGHGAADRDLPGVQRRRPRRARLGRGDVDRHGVRARGARPGRLGGTRLHVFLLTLAVVDDLVALLVIATAYTNHVSFVPLAVASASPARSPCSATRRSPGAGRPRRCSASRCGSRCSSRVSIR